MCKKNIPDKWMSGPFCLGCEKIYEDAKDVQHEMERTRMECDD